MGPEFGNPHRHVCGGRLSGSYIAVHFHGAVDDLDVRRLGGGRWRRVGFLPNWTLRVEYLHLQFDNVGESYVFTGTAAGFPFTTTSHVSANIGVDVARVGVNYLFNFGSLRSPMAY